MALPLVLDPLADEYLGVLLPDDPRAAERVETALDRLEDDPSAAPNHRHSLVPQGDDRVVWGFAVGDQMVLWREQDVTVHVLYIGPNHLF
ncbi:MAG: hypothetical protein FWE61_03255 [Micrococcales bacterium]|nr:hypothetical protein [Micrococcales bacterium]